MSSEIEKASRKKRREKYMVIYAKVQMTVNWSQIPDCVIISPSTTACSSTRGKDGGKKGKQKNKMSEDLHNTNKTPQTSVFSFGSASARLSIQPPLGFFKRHHCSTLIVVVLFVRVQAGPGRGGGIKKKKGQYDGCLLISRPLGL